ncbi:MAG TPA: hypothetical protein ENN33_14485 [Ignavibacteria bacterium]|nr:hypothetical protein [Ignavibacteria bacterium]
MKEFIKLFSLVLIIVSTLFSQRNYSFGWHYESIEVDKLERHFRIFIPRELQNETPLVLIFHTSNSGMENVFNTGDGFNEWANLAEREKFILVIPNGVNPINGDAFGTNQKWNDCRKSNIEPEQLPHTDDVGFIRELINWSIENLKINEKQIYAAGIGNGGMMVYRLAIELGDVLSGAAVFFANLPVDSECTQPVKSLPIFIMNSTDDPFVPFDGGMITGERGSVLSAEETLNFWVNLNDLHPLKRTNKYHEDVNPDDNSRVIKNEFNRPLANPPVVFYVITNSGHVVPSVKYGLLSSHQKELLGNQNRDIEGVVEAWKFLRRFSK